MIMENLKYTKDHEWLKIEGNKVYIGITDYAQNALGSIVYVELPDVDNNYSEGDSFGVVESVKAASDIYMPVDGTVVEINDTLVDDPSLVNSAPYESWMICVELSNPTQLDALLDAAAYKELLGGE